LTQLLDAVGFLEVVAEDAGLTALNLAVLCRSAAETVVQFHGFYRCRTRLILYITHTVTAAGRQTNWPHTDGSTVFARWRQCSPHLIHLTQPTQHPIGSAIFAQLTAEGPYTLQPASLFPLKITLSHRDILTPSNTSLLGPPKSTTQTASRSVQLFLHGSLV